MIKSLLTKLLSAALLAAISIGCEPRPIVEEPDSNSAVDVEVNRDGVEVERDPNDGGSAVDVQVGGGQGVQVEVDRGGQGTGENVDSEPDSN